MTMALEQRVFALRSQSRPPGLRIEAKAGDRSATVFLYDEISPWGVSADAFVKELHGLDVDELHLRVNSPGGSVFDGVAMMNALRAHPAKVVATVEGLAASAASLVLLGADEVVMMASTEQMVHEAWSLVVGPAGDLREMADNLDRINGDMAAAYAGKTGGTVDDWRGVMAKETWFTAEEAVEAGLADRVLDTQADTTVKAMFDLSPFTYQGRAKAPAPDAPRHTLPEDLMSEALRAGLRQQLGIVDQVDDAVLLAAVGEALAEAAEPLPVEVPADVQASLERLAVLEREAATARRDGLITAALKANKITPGERAAWEARYDTSPAEAERLLTALPSGRAPMQEIGTSADRDGDSEDHFYAQLFGEAS